VTEKDPWQPESGNLTNYEGTVREAYFGSDPAYNQGQTKFLILKMDTDAPEKPEHEERYNLPPDWETWDGGKTVQHKSEDATKTFNMNSQVGQLVTKIIANCPEAIDVLRERGKMTEAGVWVGLRFFFEETARPYKFKDRETGEEREGVSTKNFPTKFLGVSDGQPGLTAVTSQPAAADQSSDVIAPADRIVLKMKAKQMEHGQWVEDVMGYDGGRLLQNAELVSQLADETGLYATLRNEA